MNEETDKQKGAASGLGLFSDKKPGIITRALESSETPAVETQKVETALAGPQPETETSEVQKTDMNPGIVPEQTRIIPKTEIPESKPPQTQVIMPVPAQVEQSALEEITLESYIAERTHEFVELDSHEAAKIVSRSVRVSEVEEEFWTLYEKYRKLLLNAPSMSELIRRLIREQMNVHLSTLLELEYKQMAARTRLEHEKVLVHPLTQDVESPSSVSPPQKEQPVVTA